MLKVLLKKQLMECFRSYFVKQKTGEPRSKKQVILMFVLFGALMVFLAGSFGGMASFFAINFLDTDYSWLYYAVMGMMAILLGVFGSVFNTYSAMYLAKDNELLLSMPIPPVKILIARLSLEFIMSLLYSGIILVPSVVVGVGYRIITGSFNVLNLIFSVLLIFIVAIFVMVITSALGFLLALISTKLKRKGFLTAIVVVLLLIGYYSVAFRMQSVMNSVITHADVIAGSLKKYAYLLYLLGNAADGNVLSFLIFTAITAVLVALLLFILSKTFYRVLLGVNVESHAKGTKKVSMQRSSVKKTLFVREMRLFTSNATYMVNCGLSAILMPALAIVAMVKSKDLFVALDKASELVVEQMNFTIDFHAVLPLMAVLAIAVLVGMDMITLPSVSMEGKTIWILQSLPVEPKNVLRAKLKVQIVVNGIPAVISAIILSIAMKIQLVDMLLVITTVLAYNWFSGAYGLIIGLKHPIMNWTNANIPVKQNMSMFLVMLVNFAVAVVLPSLFILVQLVMPSWLFLVILTVLLSAVSLLLQRWLDQKGTKLFSNL